MFSGRIFGQSPRDRRARSVRAGHAVQRDVTRPSVRRIRRSRDVRERERGRTRELLRSRRGLRVPRRPRRPGGRAARDRVGYRYEYADEHVDDRRSSSPSGQITRSPRERRSICTERYVSRVATVDSETADAPKSIPKLVSRGSRRHVRVGRGAHLHLLGGDVASLRRDRCRRTSNRASTTPTGTARSARAGRRRSRREGRPGDRRRGGRSLPEGR